MALRFIGIDPETQGQGSPTVWVDEDNGELVFQGWRAGQDLASQIAETPWVPGHATGIPAHETVVRIPARMVPMIMEACNVAEQPRLR